MRPLRILLVEDDVLIGALLAEMLAEMGYSVCSVETTEAAAVNTALVARPDLMIVDAHLGSGSGIAAVETIFKTLAIPHIFVSGDRISTGRASTIVLQKPFKQQDLLQAIEQTIDTATKARVVCVQELDPMQHYHSVAAGRRAVRDYTAVPVDEQTIGLLIADAVQAPSAIDEQPWAFTVVRDQALLDRASSEAKAHKQAHCRAISRRGLMSQTSKFFTMRLCLF